VISVDYRRGPEAKFPTAHKDAFAAYKWVLANTTFLKIDASRVAVAGEDAGGNLACNVSIMARDSSITMPKHQLLIYPIAQADMTTPSYQQYASALPLNAAQMNYFLNNYLANTTQRTDTRISLVNANLSNLPPTTIINADIDPLRDDGLMLENKLKISGVPVSRKIYDGVTHDFYGLNVVLSSARDAEGYGNAALRQYLQ
jgi:acetyl esterase/lipase